MASIMTSMPLFGESRPNVRMTALSLKPSLALASSGSTNANVGNAVRDDFDLFVGHLIDGAQAVRGPFSAMTTTLRRDLDDVATARRAAPLSVRTEPYAAS